MPKHLPVYSLCLTALWGAGIAAFGSSGVWAQDMEVPLDLLGYWRAETLRGAPVEPDVMSLLEFEETGVVDGHGGCNKIFGPLQVEIGSIRIGPLSVTRKACPPKVLDQEQTFLRALAETRDFKKLPEEGALLLLDGTGAQVARFVQVK